MFTGVARIVVHPHCKRMCYGISPAQGGDGSSKRPVAILFNATLLIAHGTLCKTLALKKAEEKL